MTRFPNWVWWIIGGVLVLIVCALLRVNVGIEGGQFHFGQGLIH